MSVVDGSFGHPMKLEERASMPLAGGMMQQGYQCGMLWGAALAGGAQAYRLYGAGPQAEARAIHAAQRVVEAFRAQTNHIDCFEITELDWRSSSQRGFIKQVFKFLIKGGPIGCFRLAAKYAPLAFGEINAAFSQEPIEAPSPPVSCAAMVAQKMGASDMHAVMAAGLAGGIGLSGGGCGALGAAIWLITMDSGREGVEKIEMTPSRGQDAIDSFLKSADFEFECAEIVGRKFESVDDHAEYLRAGGCSEIIQALAAAHSPSASTASAR